MVGHRCLIWCIYTLKFCYTSFRIMFHRSGWNWTTVKEFGIPHISHYTTLLVDLYALVVQCDNMISYIALLELIGNWTQIVDFASQRPEPLVSSAIKWCITPVWFLYVDYLLSYGISHSMQHYGWSNPWIMQDCIWPSIAKGVTALHIGIL